MFVNDVDDTTKKVQLCKKRTYSSKKHAQTVLNVCQQRKRKKQPQRIYRCAKCQGWHLTSKLKKNKEMNEM